MLLRQVLRRAGRFHILMTRNLSKVARAELIQIVREFDIEIPAVNLKEPSRIDEVRKPRQMVILQIAQPGGRNAGVESRIFDAELLRDSYLFELLANTGHVGTGKPVTPQTFSFQQESINSLLLSRQP